MHTHFACIYIYKTKYRLGIKPIVTLITAALITLRESEGNQILKQSRTLIVYLVQTMHKAHGAITYLASIEGIISFETEKMHGNNVVLI